MRWAVLYARSRQVPTSVAALTVGTAAVWFLARDNWTLLPVSLALTVGIAVAATGLSGQDADLDRTAAIRWRPRRGIHLLLIGGLTFGAVLLPRLWEAGQVMVPVVARNAAGLLGLAGISAMLFGGAFGWTLPLFAFAVAYFTPPGTDTGTEIVAWLLQPTSVTAAAWTATVLGVAGFLAYTVFGTRR
jgi:hypothetical protein